jgi:hypothetical protein
MGRPLNKKYFGNRNTGSASTTADNGIGGGAVASVSAGTVGNFVVSDTYQNFPSLTVAVPTLPNGVRAVLTPVYELDTVTFSSGGQTDADYLAGLSTSIPSLGGGAVVNIVEVANKVTAVNLTGGNRGEFRRGDITGVGLTTHQVLQAPNAGTDLQINVTFRVKRIEVTEAGSGYTVTPALTWGGHDFTTQTTPSAQTVTMLVDSGTISTTGNQENAIVMTAFLTGGSATTVDIIRQVSTNRYKVTDGTRTTNGTTIPHVQLQSTLANAAGECSIAATDSAGGEYFVTKLTARKATVTRAGGSGWLYATGQAAPWKFDTAAGIYLQIANA